MLLWAPALPQRADPSSHPRGARTGSPHVWPPPGMEKVPGTESWREEARLESEAERRLCSDIWRSVSQLRFLAPESWFLANCVQFVSNPKQMGLCPAPTRLRLRLRHSPPDPGAPESREGPPASNQAARPPAGKVGRSPFWGVAQPSGRGWGVSRPSPTLVHASVTARGQRSSHSDAVAPSTRRDDKPSG